MINFKINNFFKKCNESLYLPFLLLIFFSACTERTSTKDNIDLPPFYKNVTGHNAYNFSKKVDKNLYKIKKEYIKLFYMSANTGNLETLVKLVDLGVNVNIRFQSGITALHLAVARDDIKMVKYLLEAGADTTAMDKDYMIPTLVASNSSSKYILEDEMKKQTKKLDADFQKASFYQFNMKKIKDIVKKNGINSTLKFKRTFLFYAAQNGSFELAKWLINKGIDVNQVEILGIPPLHEAIKSRSLEVVKLLIENGAYVGIRDKFGRTAQSLSLNSTPEIRDYIRLVVVEQSKNEDYNLILQENIHAEEAFSKWLNEERLN